MLPLIFLHGWCIGTLALWGLAFFAPAGPTPAWLLQAQLACFGRTETGLPDAGGWLLLSLAPLTLLASFLCAFGSALLQELRGRMQLFLLAVWLAFALVEGTWVVRRLDAASRVVAATFTPTEDGKLPPEYPFLSEAAPAFTLTDQSGTTVSLENFRGQVVLLGFVFAHCQTVCPVLVHNLKTAHAALGSEGFVLVFITLDPRRDTPGSLPSLARRYELTTNEFLLSGEVEIVEHVSSAYRLSAQRDERTGDVSHPPLVYVIGREGELGYALLNPPAAWIIEAARRVGTP